MSSDGPCHSISNVLAGFTSAESVAEEVIELILAEGGKQLYDKYIHRKSFLFSSQAISDLLVAELKMCFVRHDEGEPPVSFGSIADLRAGSSSASYASEAGAACSTAVPASAVVPMTPPQVYASETRASEAPEAADASAVRSPSKQSADREATAHLEGSAQPEVTVSPKKKGAAALLKGLRSGEVTKLVDQMEVAAEEPAFVGSVEEGGATGSDRGPAGDDCDGFFNEADVAGDEVSCSNWTLEAEPVRCRIDTWARACVPVRRIAARPKTKLLNESQNRKMQVTGGSRGKKNSVNSSRSPSRLAMIATPTGGQSQGKLPEEEKAGSKSRDGMIQLEEKVEQDEEEAAMREMKEREAKRKREEDNRIQRKATEEAEEAARLAQVKDQMKNKPFTYDSAGNIIWVQALAAEKLPSANAIPTFVLRREIVTSGEDHQRSQERKLSLQRPVPVKELGRKTKGGKNKDGDFVDGFKKFSSQQPPVMETMTMAPGVKLKERGSTKSGEENSAGGKRANSLMSRKDYEMLVQSGGSTGYPPKEKETSKEQGNATNASEDKPTLVAAAEGGEKTNEQRHSEPPLNSSRGLNSGVKAKVSPVSPSGIVPHAPAMPRPEQPVPPPSVRRVQMKRDALGFGLSTRERLPTSQGSRFPACGAPPVLGATMGHGLVPQSSKFEEYYFPHAAGLGVPISGDDEEISPPISPQGSAAASPRAPQHGQIVSKNPDLVKRLFNR